jgi:hypothetical protein
MFCVENINMVNVQNLEDVCGNIRAEENYNTENYI